MNDSERPNDGTLEASMTTHSAPAYTQHLCYGVYGFHDLNGQCSISGFNGEYLDKLSGCYFLGNGARVYSPILMRFCTPDEFSPFDAGGRNTYAYCLGDPINYSDPSGNNPFWRPWARFWRPWQSSAHSPQPRLIVRNSENSQLGIAKASLNIKRQRSHQPNTRRRLPASEPIVGTSRNTGLHGQPNPGTSNNMMNAQPPSRHSLTESIRGLPEHSTQRTLYEKHIGLSDGDRDEAIILALTLLTKPVKKRPMTAPLLAEIYGMDDRTLTNAAYRAQAKIKRAQERIRATNTIQ